MDGFGATIALCAETLALGALGQPERATEKAMACRAVVELTEQSGFLAQPLVEFHVFALAVAGHVDEALAVAEAHLTGTDDEPSTPQSQAAAAHRRVGRRGAAMTATSRAERLAAACGGAVSPAIELARLAVPFTRREHEIALLVARGLSNREIADAVSLSVRTIEGHIYRASCKVGVARRSDLAGAIRDLTRASTST